MVNLPNLTPRILQNTLKLVRLYNTTPQFRQEFDSHLSDPKVLFQGVPLKVYLRIITATSLKYRRYEKEVRSDPEKFKELLILFYKDPGEFGKLDKMVQNSILGKDVPVTLTPEETELVTKIEQTPEGKEKQSYIGKLEQSLQKSQPKEEVPKTPEVPKEPKEAKLPQFTPPQLTLPKIQLPSFSKDLALSGQITLKKFISRYTPQSIGGVVGAGGGLIMAGPPGAIIGFVGGIASGTMLSRALEVKPPKKISSRSVTEDTLLPPRPPAQKRYPRPFLPILPINTIIIGVFLSLGIMALFVLFFGGGGEGAGEAAPLPPGYSGGEVTSCKFTRGDLKPKEAAYQSPRLLSYIQEASRISTIPAVVLAAFMRVEVPSVSSKTDETLASVGCPKSSTGALGLMQIQPKETKGHDGPAVAQGAKLIGKTYDGLIEADYCSMQKNITMGAGFILKKMSYKGYGDGTKWDPAWTNDKKAIEVLVDSYYGCHLYGGNQDCTGPYNYAEDVWTSIQSCKATPEGPKNGDYVGWMKDNFNINFEAGFSDQVYRWAYEALNSTFETAPKFKTLLGGEPIDIRSTCGVSNTRGRIIYIRNSRLSCLSAEVDGPAVNEKLFKHVLIHELSHIINGSYRPGKYGEQLKEVINKEGYLTAYSQRAATADNVICGEGDLNTRADEDFAESVSYFINTKTEEQNYGCGVNLNQNPVYAQAGGKLFYPAHYDFIAKLLKL